MDSIIELVFNAIPVKLILTSCVFYFWYKLQKNSPNIQRPIYRFAIAIAVISSLLALASIKKLYPYGVLTDILAALLASIAATSLASQFKIPTMRFIASAIPLLLITIFPLFYILHYSMVGGPLNYDSLVAIFQSNTAEAGEYVSSFTSLINILIIFIALSLISWLAYRFSTTNDPQESTYNVLKPSLILLFIFIIIPKDKGLFSYPFVSFSNYLNELSQVKSNQQEKQKSNAAGDFIVSKSGKGETYIVIVGESLNKHHMGIYNYEKNTTPKLDSLVQDNELIVFPHAYSNYPGTMAALSWALSASNQHNKRNFVDSIGLVDVYNKAGFKTIWLGNQPISNSYDMLLGFIANSADDVTITFDIEFHGMSHENHKPDGVLLPHLEQALANRDSDENTVIFIHLMGNHTHYCERYPKEFEKFSMSFLEETWMRVIKGGLGHSKTCYDNSVLYNDFVVSSIINQLQISTKAKPAGLLYFADHSEDITRGVGHSSANFSYDMVESPTIMWLSDGYKEKYPEKMNAIKMNQNELYSNDSIFDTALGMSGVQLEEEHYCSRCDITSSHYDLQPKDAYTMHGRLKYVTKENPWIQNLLTVPEKSISTK